MRKLKKDWLASYKDFVSDTESPKQYNYWCAVSAVSASLKRHVYIPYGKYNIYPNQYVILVGPPGIGKGTAINPAVDMVKKADTVNYISDRVTSEKIIEKLGAGFQHIVPGSQPGSNKVTVGDSSATIVSTELPIFLQASEWMLPLMCEMWDRNEFSYETKTKGSVGAKDLCVGLLGGCVPDYIRKLNRDATAAVTGGFTSRCIFVFANEKEQLIPWPKDIGTFKQLEADLINDLQHIGGLKGTFKFSLNARKMWENNYTQICKTDQFASEVMTGFISRMKSHIFKLAMVLSVSSRDDLVIDEVDLFNSIAMVNAVRDTLDITFRSVGESPLAVAQDRILAYLEAKGMATFNQILRDNIRHVTDDGLRSIMLVLETAEFVTTKAIGNKTSYLSTGKPRGKGAGIP